MAMRNDNNICRLLSMHIWRLDLADLNDQVIQTLSKLRRGLSILTPISPNIPLRVLIQSLIPPNLLDLSGQKALISSILPLPNILRDLRRVLQLSALCLGEEQLVSVASACAGGDVDFGEVLGVDDLSGPDYDMAGAGDLGFADVGEGDVGAAGVTAVDGPLGLSWDGLV